MNLRKTLLVLLILAVASLGLTLTGCDKKSDQPTPPAQTGTEAAPGEEPAVEQPSEEAAPAEHPAGEHPAGEHPE